MSKVAMFVGPEARKHREPEEDPASALRLAALTASWAAHQGHTLLLVADAPAVLALGTAVMGTQQSRVVEGGERRPSPIRVLALLESGDPGLDRALSFERRPRERFAEDPEPGRFEEDLERRETFGDLSLLMDVGILDLASDSETSLVPRAPEEIAEVLTRRLFEERPRGVLAFGQVPDRIVLAAGNYAREIAVPFSSALGHLQGPDRLRPETVAPMLDGRILRVGERRRFEGGEDEAAVDTVDEELMQVARWATWEAEMTFQLYRWLGTLEETRETG